MVNGQKIIFLVLVTSANFSLIPVCAQAPPPEPIDALPPIPATGCPSAEEAQRQFRSISDIKVGMQLEGKEVPPDCSENVFVGRREGYAFSQTITEFHWAPANFFHQPTYFSDVPLERYGQSIAPHLQPIISGGRFFLTLPIVPYKMGVDHPCDCVTTLGYYRPGVCAPCVMQVPPPLQWNGALLQAGTTVALVLLLP